ncbi:MAG: transketolase [Nitrospinota bacterium]|nr:transketolase [Nitrospinota bacterium]
MVQSNTSDSSKMEIPVPPIEQLSINTIRTLSMDAVQKANSGHPGTPMALAPLAYQLWVHEMKYNPSNPHWFDRDRFVLSCGHASMLLYSVLYLSGYGISLDDIINFRQWNSKTPGHPEYGLTPGVETTTGPLGQGFMNGVGMAMAEAHMAKIFNKSNYNIVDHNTFVLLSDGDIMEGASHEAASLAGHLGLGKLICIYDDNKITIDGTTDLSYSDDIELRFKGYGWDVSNLGDVSEDCSQIGKSIDDAKKVDDKPSLIVLRTQIGYGSPKYQNTSRAHGAPLGEEEVIETKKIYGWPSEEQFYVPEAVLEHMNGSQKGESLEMEWNELFESYRSEFPEMAKDFETSISDEIPNDFAEEIPKFLPSKGAMATRVASGLVLNEIAKKIPWLMGGSADLAASNNSLIENSGNFSKDSFENKNINWGIREHVMCAASSGMLLHGGIRPFAATFFAFTDYARPAIRLSCLMGLPLIYVMTHDSIGLGEDGPTHQPIEHLASLRAIPELHVIRPCDANETAVAWRISIQRKDGPTMLVLTRQSLPVLDRDFFSSEEGLARGAYVISKEEGETPDAILISSGSEVALSLDAQKALKKKDVNVRVVSMPCWELFRSQEQAYRDSVLPPGINARLSIEAASDFGWLEWVGDNGGSIAIPRFGASAPGGENFEKLGFNVANIINRLEKIMI